MIAPWPEHGLERQRQCPVCDESRRELLYAGLTDRYFQTAPGTWQMHLCLGCRSGYLDPRPTPETIGLAYREYLTHGIPAFEPLPLGEARRKLSNGYLNARYNARLEPASPLGRFIVPFFPVRRARVDREVRHLVRRGDRPHVLDVGCGNGLFLDKMDRAGWQSIGIDPDPQAVHLSRERGLTVNEGTLATFDAEPGSFDAITLGHVLEHLHDPRVDLRRARELLKPDGVLWLATPNLSSAGHADFRSLWLGLDPPRHLVVFNRSSLARLLADVGFRVLRRPIPAWSELIYAYSAHLAGRVRPTGALRFRPLVTHLTARLQQDRTEEILLLATPA